MNNQDNEYMSLTPNRIDFQAYLGSVKDAILQITRDQLFNNISLTMHELKNQSKENSKDSLVLLQAMKPFMNEEVAENIDKLSEIFGDIQALKMFIDNYMNANRSNEAYTIEATDEKKVMDKQGDLIIEDNTVYEIDQTCEPEVST